jgi:rSAM/selenodomain-associated transferase 2/rSAM/selenodomain-associated transferase 1
MPAARPEHLIVFTRFPEPGKTKTRMIPALGPRGAARLQRQLTEHMMATAATLNGQNGLSVEVRYEGGTRALMQDWLGPKVIYRPQGSGNLGQRMQRAFAAAFRDKAAAVVLVGSDIPGISGDILRQAFEALRKKDLVLGPAKDGGYYLIGIRKTLPAETYGRLFDGIDWGSERVLAQTLHIARDLGLHLTQLESLADVDRPEDLPAWYPAQKIATLGVPQQKLSIIIPALNEADSIESTLSHLERVDNLEIIVVDGGSTDGTVDLARSWGAKVIQTTAGKAIQMNSGAAAATGKVLVFLHADTRMPKDFVLHIHSALNQKDVVAGAFRLSIDSRAAGIRFIEHMADLRSRLLQLPYGDQALFMKKSIFEAIGGFADVPIMEDFMLVRRLRRKGKIAILPAAVITSPRRWLHFGIFKTWWVNQMIIIAYYLGIPPERLARWYRRDAGKKQTNSATTEFKY